MCEFCTSSLTIVPLILCTSWLCFFVTCGNEPPILCVSRALAITASEFCVQFSISLTLTFVVPNLFEPRINAGIICTPYHPGNLCCISEYAQTHIHFILSMISHQWWEQFYEKMLIIIRWCLFFHFIISHILFVLLFYLHSNCTVQHCICKTIRNIRLQSWS